MGRMKDLMHKLFNDKMGDYGEPLDSVETILGEIDRARRKMVNQQNVTGQCPVVHVPTPSSGTICLPKGTSIDMNASSKAIAQAYEDLSRQDTRPHFSTIANGWVNPKTGEPCNPDGSSLSVLDENGWRRE